MMRPTPLILLIDDDPMVHKLVSTMLINAGYDVAMACSGAEGLEQAKKIQPDLIILDIMMPDVNGFEVMMFLKADPLTSIIPVIFFSGNVYSADKIKAMDLGAADFIEKPFERAEFLSRISTYLKIRLLGQKGIDLAALKNISPDDPKEDEVASLAASLASQLTNLALTGTESVETLTQNWLALGRLLKSRGFDGDNANDAGFNFSSSIEVAANCFSQLAALAGDLERFSKIKSLKQPIRYEGGRDNPSSPKRKP